MESGRATVWGGAQQGAQLRLKFQTAVAGRYQVYLRFTRAPDFALMRASFDGAPAIAINGYAPTVSSARALLGMLDLAPGARELLVEIAMKDAKSSGLNVGLDRLELEPVATGQSAGSGVAVAQAAGQIIAGRQGSSASGSQGTVGPIIAAAQLAFAVYTPNDNHPILGGTDRNVYRPVLSVSLAWKAVGTLPHRWQVTSQHPGTTTSLTPVGLLAHGPATPGSFQIALDSFQPLAPGGVRNRDVARDFYIRIIPVTNGAAVGVPSNVVVAHYVPGKDPGAVAASDAYANTANAVKKLAEMKEQAKMYEVTIVKFTPIAFAKAERWGCVVVVANPTVGTGTAYSGYLPGQEVCPQKDVGMSYHAKDAWDVLGGWVKAYDAMATFFSSTKSWISTKIGELAPCEAMGSSLAGTCEEFVTTVAAAGISAGLTAAGLPPYLPNVSELQGVAEGQVVQAAVDFTCLQFEAQGGQCTPEMRKGLAVLYQSGIDQLQKDVATAAKEPGCGNAAEAAEYARKPLPCFSTLGIDVKPAPGAVTEPASITVRVRRVKPNPPFPMPACALMADLNLTNYYEGGAPYAVNLKPQTIQANPFVRPETAVPPLTMGESRDVTLVFDKLKPFQLSGNYSNFWMYDWLHLYKGGKGPLSAFTRTVTTVAGAKNQVGTLEKLDCGVSPGLQVQIPK